MWQMGITWALIVAAVIFIGRRLYRFLRSVRTKGKKAMCQDCPLVNACISGDEPTEKCPQNTKDTTTECPR